VIIRSFEWDDTNRGHIARHNVSPEEAEEACTNNPVILKSREQHYYIFGQTDNGRFLTIIVKFRFGGLARVVTARNMSNAERSRYRRK